MTFEELYDAHHRIIYMACLKILKDPSEAEDLTQDAFLKIWQNLHKFEGRSNIKTWMYQIAVNECLMYLRKKKHKMWTETAGFADDKAKELFLEGIPLEHEPMDTQIDLQQEMQTLAPGYRRTLELTAQGYNHKEVGSIMGVSDGCVKSQLWKARGILKRKLERKGNPTVWRSVS
jgi:RNA polymerase sigma-70 factor (ECF subfamily)